MRNNKRGEKMLKIWCLMIVCVPRVFEAKICCFVARCVQRESHRHSFQPSSRVFSREISLGRMNSHHDGDNAVERKDVQIMDRSYFIENFFGGDFAGHFATYDASNGKLIKVPEHLVPKIMVEWGQVPSCLEVLTSESISTDGNNSEENTGLVLNRRELKVLPEVGCGIDNLETLSEDFSFRFSENEKKQVKCFGDLDGICVLCITQPDESPRGEVRTKVEAVFSMRGNSNNYHLPEMKDVELDFNQPDKKIEHHSRIRIQMYVTKYSILSPIKMTCERKVSNLCTLGKFASGGGLDGRTVSKLVGKDNINKPFVQNDNLRIKANDDDDKEVHCLTFPGNIFLKYSKLFDNEGCPSKILNLHIGLLVEEIEKKLSPEINLTNSEEYCNEISGFKTISIKLESNRDFIS
mmetsp:Transcript_21224/g.29737  ORF Transcript_21224/g.29737 Transcript_21224/m.29737 type:complete len:408 (+) Transcript_21224:84-1307(+)